MKKNSIFRVYDIVTISSNYMSTIRLDIAQPLIKVYSIMSINADGTITLEGVWPNIPAQYIEGVPIKSELSNQIYYDTIHALPYEIGKVHIQEDVYNRPPFYITIKERFANTQIWNKLQSVKFHYIHELQHWFVDNLGYSRISINHCWGMKKPLFL